MSFLHEEIKGAETIPAVERVEFFKNLRRRMIGCLTLGFKDTQMLVEVCTNSLQSALNAQDAGADRIELCSELGVGGLTPSHGLLNLVKKKLAIPIHVLIRPRSGHFTYSNTEFEVMLADVEYCKTIGVQGIVSGVLTSKHKLDVKRTAKLVELAKPLHFTFHRAFDWVPNPWRALEELQNMGVDTVLTSGQKESALQGLENLGKWQKTTKVNLMAGAGVHSENAKLFKDAGLRAIHLSGTTFGKSVDVSNNITMNSEKHLSESQVAVTNVEVIRQTIQQVK